MAPWCSFPGRVLAAASGHGLTLLDAQLRALDSVPKPVDAVASVGEQLAVGFSDGKVVRYEVERDRVRGGSRLVTD